MNKNKNVMIKRGAGIGLAALMAVSVSGCGVNENSIQASSAEQEKETKEAVITHGAKDNKNEMVYVVAKNDGSAEKTIVTEWLSNPSELKEIIDFSDLKDIENLKGDEGFSVDEDGKLVWKAGGKDIYYRGTLDKELPVDVHITYTLDGKEISPDELAGKSGKLTMTFEYTNNMKKEVKIGDEKTDIYMPFAVISGAVFDNEKVSELTVEGGKAVNDGERTLVVGLALPGLSESLGIDRANHDLLGDIDIPEKIVISANVKDFSLMTTLTLVDNSIFKELGLSDGKTDLSGISGLMDQMLGAFEKIVSGSEELAGGAKELDTGAKALKDGMDSLKDGLGALSDGAAQLADGSAKVDNGAAQLQSGAGKLKGGIDTLSSGIGQLSDGAAQLDGGISLLAEKTAVLPGGIEKLLAGLKSIRSALKSGDASSQEKYGIYEAASAAAKGCDAIMAGLKSGMTDAENMGIYEAAGAVFAGAKNIEKGLVSGSEDPAQYGIYEAASALYDGLSIVPQAVESAKSALASEEGASAYTCDVAAEAAINSVINSENLTAEQRAALTQALTYIAYSKQYETGVADGLSNIDVTSASAAAMGIKQGALALADGAEKISEAGYKMQGGAEKLYAGAGLVKKADAGIAAGIDMMISGNNGNNLDAAISGVEVLSASSGDLIGGIQSLKEGAGKLAAGLKSANDNMPALSEGAAALESGLVQLGEGTKALASGAADLADGAAKADSGAAELAAGAGKLSEGTEKLAGGAEELSGGLKAFDEQAVLKIKDFVDSDINDSIDRVKAMVDYANEYTSFAGSNDDKDTGVKFVIRTGSIG